MLEPAALLPEAVPESQSPALRVVREGPPSAGTEARPPGPPSARLEIPPYDLTSALVLERELGVSHVLAQALVRRGFAHPLAARAFLDAREEHPPAAFDGIDRTVALIQRHINSGSRITVHGDYDVDGVCATAIMVRALRTLGADVGWFLPARIEDGYGLSAENVRSIAALARTASPGLRALMVVASVDPSALDARTLAFRLAPRINAAGRLRRADAGVELLLTGDERRAAQIAAELDEANSERRAVERQIAWEADAQVEQLGDRSAYVLAGAGWHPGVIGIVASRVVERHHRPTVLV